MPRQRSHAERRAMFRNMGTGAKVKLVKKFGINDVPVGSEGIIVEHFGKDRTRPVVAFSGHGRRVLQPDLIKVIKPSNKFEPIRSERIKVYGTKNELKKKLLEHGFTNGGDNYVYSYEYLDDGEGHSADVRYSVKINDNNVEINLKKSDIPNRWRYDYDGILEGVAGKVESSLGVTR